MDKEVQEKVACPHNRKHKTHTGTELCLTCGKLLSIDKVLSYERKVMPPPQRD